MDGSIPILFQIIIIIDNIMKIIFNIIGIQRLIKINSNLRITNKYLIYSNIDNSSEKNQIYKLNWTFCSMTKFIILKLIAFIYISIMAIYALKNILFKENSIIDSLFYKEYLFYIYYSINIITWIILIRIYYKQYRIYKDQNWYGIKAFWILNFIIILIKLLLIFNVFKNNSIYDLPNILFIVLLCLISLFSFLLFLLAIFHPIDIIIKPKIVDKDENKMGIQEDLVSCSDDYFENQYFKDKLKKKITIEINKIKFNLELKIKTKDFSQLDFKMKIEDITYIKTKSTIYVCNFNEIVLKYYNNKNKSNNVLNLLKQAYNISLTLNPRRNSFNGNLKDTYLLGLLYLEIIKIDNEFLLNFIDFLEINNDELNNILTKNYTSIYKQNPLINKEIERLDSSSIFNNKEDSSFIDSSIVSSNKNTQNINNSIIENKEK